MLEWLQKGFALAYLAASSGLGAIDSFSTYDNSVILERFRGSSADLPAC